MCAYKSEYKLTNMKWNDAVAVFISGMQDAGDPWTGASLCLFLAESQSQLVGLVVRLWTVSNALHLIECEI